MNQTTKTWKNTWGQNRQGNTSTTFQKGQGTGTTGFGAKSPYTPKPTSSSQEIRTSGMKLNNDDYPIDTINDLSVNDHFVVAAASWSGLKIWRNVPKTDTSTQGTYGAKQIPYSFDQIDGDLVKNGFMFRNPESNNVPEPIIRCTFDTLRNNIIYYGNAWGQIFEVCLEEAVRDQSFGYQKSMITGLKYCRDKRAIASSSTDGLCFLWDPRQGQYQCAKVETNINCTNLDFVQNTIGICGIKMDDSTPVVKLYDIRNLTNPLPPPKPTAYSFGKPQTSTTTTTTTSTTSTFQKTSFGLNSQKPPYSEIKSYTVTDYKGYALLRQFTSIVLDRSGTNFVAGTIGGFIVSSKINQTGFDETPINYGVKPKVTQTSGGFSSKATQPPKQENNENLRFKAINSLAMIQAPIRGKDFTAHAIFAGTSSGHLVALTGFRSYEKQGNTQQYSISFINSDYASSSSNENPVTAVAVSPNGKYLAYAFGDDYREGSKYRFSVNESLRKKTDIKVKTVIVSEDFKKDKI